MSNGYSTQRARELRRVSTPAERRLWECLSERRLHGLKFRRQQPLHGYIVDFYCAECRLIVELDGAVHQDQEQLAYDDYRNGQLHERGLTVLRFTNGEVERSPQVVLARIAMAAGVLPGHTGHPTPRLTPPFGYPSPSTTDGEGPAAERIVENDEADVSSFRS